MLSALDQNEIIKVVWAVKERSLWKVVEVKDSNYTRENFENKAITNMKCPTDTQLSMNTLFLLLNL